MLGRKEQARLAELKKHHGRIPFVLVRFGVDGVKSTVMVQIDMHDAGRVFVDLSDPVLRRLSKSRDERLGEVLELILHQAQHEELRQMEQVHARRCGTR